MKSSFPQRATVMGLGRFGGGLGAARWLLEKGARVTVTDLQSAEQLAAPLAELGALHPGDALHTRLGAHDERDFRECDLLVVNPAVPRPWANPFIAAARASGVAITTEVGMLLDHLPSRRIVAVTGTAGKSTTATLIHRLLEVAGLRAWLGGNIGGSLLSRLDRIGTDDWIVLELSSFMLHWLGGEGGGHWSPHIGVFTNLGHNHIDWHGSLEHYSNAKRAIRAHQTGADRFLTRFEVETPDASARLGAELGGAWWAEPDLSGFSDRLEQRLRLAMPGEHARRNARLALDTVHAVQSEIGAPIDDSIVDSWLRTLESFQGLPHRLSLIAEVDGVRWFDDSKSTTAESLLVAVAAFDDPARIHLIAGGYDKGADLSPVAALGPRVAGLYAIGATGPTLARAPGATLCGTLEAAVGLAAQRARPGDCVLLSPGCASWDQFANYEARGRRFAELVRSFTGAATR